MKFIILLLVTVAFLYVKATEEHDQCWQDWKVQHSKMFLSKDQETRRKATFIANKVDHDEHNEKFHNGEVTWTKEMNKFADLTPAQLIERYTGIQEPAVKTNMTTPVAVRGSHPAAFDYRQSGGLTPVKNQAQCGSCWTFSSCSALENAYWRKMNYLGSLAEQNFVDCVYSRGGCSGGWMYEAFDYAKKGIAWTTDYPYTATSGTCRASQLQGRMSVMTAATAYSQAAADDESIKTLVYNNGVLSVCVDAGGFGSYGKGIFKDSRMATQSPQCTHAVAIVGYGSENGCDYYVIRNSWGADWGEAGYIRMSAKRLSNGNRESALITEQCWYPHLA